MTVERFCTNCGAPQRPGAEFCVQCGTAQAPIPTPPVVATAPPPPPAAAPMAAEMAASSLLPASLRLPLPQLAALVAGVSVGVAALAVALTIALTPPGGKGGDGNGQGNGSGNGPGTGAGGLEVVEVANISAQVPVAWDVVTRARDTIVVEDEASHALWLRSATIPTPMTATQVQERFLDRARSQSPDARICAGPETAAVAGGPADGTYFIICSTFVPQGGGQAVRLADAYYVGLDGPGVTVAVMQLTAVPQALEGFAAAVRALPAPHWKLFP